MRRNLFYICFLYSFVSNAETILCRGSHWSYKFEINGSTCKHQQKVIKELYMYKVGHIQGYDKMSSVDCWASSSKIQMDGAKCCVNDAVDASNLNCKDKKISF